MSNYRVDIGNPRGAGSTDAMSDDISEIVRQLRTGEAIDRTAIAATLERLSAGKEEAFQWADKFKARAEAAEARLHAMSDDSWQPIETAPKVCRRILVYRPRAKRYPVVGVDYWSDELGSVWAKSPRDEQPTHWMPLPEPPSET